MTFPESFNARRFDFTYDNLTFLLSESEKGNKIGMSGSKRSPCWILTFALKTANVDVPIFRYKTEVIYRDGMISVEIPQDTIGTGYGPKRLARIMKEQAASAPGAGRRNTAPHTPRQVIETPVVGDVVESRNPRESAAKCIVYLNRFAEKNNFTFDVVDGKLSLIKTDRIG